MSALQITGTAIGPESWRDGTFNNIRLTQSIICQSNKSFKIAATSDPSPNQREIYAELSNYEASKYGRDVRFIAKLLRESYVRTNEEIKSMLSFKLTLEKLVDNVRKDIHLNHETKVIRSSRPNPEKISDGADDLFEAEMMHLKHIKQDIEGHLKNVKYQIKSLDEARNRLLRVINERSTVTDLLCHTVSAGDLPIDLRRSHTVLTDSKYQQASRSTTSSMTNRQSLDLGPLLPHRARTPGPSLSLPLANPLSAYSPDCEQALRQAGLARDLSSSLRASLAGLVDRVEQFREAARQAVNEGLTRKIAETAALKQQLELARVDARLATNRSQRLYHATEKALGQTEGPYLSADLTSREKLDRPLIRVFQRHPGNQVPEAQGIIRASEDLRDSLTATSKNLELLRLADARLGADLLAKSRAMDVDLVALRHRREKGRARWSVGAGRTSRQPLVNGHSLL